MKKVEALSRLAGGNPRGCNVGIYIEWSRGNCCGCVCRFEITSCDFKFRKIIKINNVIFVRRFCNGKYLYTYIAS